MRKILDAAIAGGDVKSETSKEARRAPSAIVGSVTLGPAGAFEARIALKGFMCGAGVLSLPIITAAVAPVPDAVEPRKDLDGFTDADRASFRPIAAPVLASLGPGGIGDPDHLQGAVGMFRLGSGFDALPLGVPAAV